MRQRFSTVASLAVAITVFAGVACEKLNLFLPTRNEKPVASFIVVEPIDLTIPAYYPVVFDAGASTDDSDAGVPVEYRWDFGDGTNALKRHKDSGTRVEHQYFVANGSFTVTLRVVDNDGEISEPVSRRVELRRNKLPIASFTSRFESSQPRLVTFDASASTDPDEVDRDFLTYRWAFEGPADPRTEETKNPLIQHLYAPSSKPETYLVTLTVIDSKRAESTIKAFITVPLPVVSAGGVE